jgi:hypothetical protein
MHSPFLHTDLTSSKLFISLLKTSNMPESMAFSNRIARISFSTFVILTAPCCLWLNCNISYNYMQAIKEKNVACYVNACALVLSDTIWGIYGSTER